MRSKRYYHREKVFGPKRPHKSGACAMTTKILDNKITTFESLLSWHFPRKAAFWTIFLSAPHSPPRTCVKMVPFVLLAFFPSFLVSFACSPEKFCEYFFRVCLGILHWKMAGIFGEFFLVSVSHETKHEKSSKNSGKIRSKIRGKIRDEKFEKFGKLSFCNFSDRPHLTAPQ